MKLSKCIMRRFRGVPEEAAVSFSGYNVIVGRNDSGKSTILKALDLFLNDAEASEEMRNRFSESTTCEIELCLEGPDTPVTIDEAIQTTLVDEDLVAENGQLVLKKIWDTSRSKITPEVYIWRKAYEVDDFLLLSERDLMALCRRRGIEATKANGEEYNNVEKRGRLRRLYDEQNAPIQYKWEQLPTTGRGRGKLIHDAVRRILPRFEYFHADTPLSESDTAIQRYFKQISTEIFQQAGVDGLEEQIERRVGGILSRITDKINEMMVTGQEVRPTLTFNWGNVLQTGFTTVADDTEVPLRLRGDGFRRITMMAYFQHLAEEGVEEHQNIVFGFEEPETFLHPAGQEQLFSSLMGMAASGYQVLVTTHSPVIVANSERSKLVHVKGAGRSYEVLQDLDDFRGIVADLGITPGNQFIEEFEKARLLVLVEGKDDVKAFSHVAELYKENALIEHAFSDLQIVLIPIGGCDSIKHWLALNILRDLGKRYYVVQDSDKHAPDAESPREKTLIDLGLVPQEEFWVLSKRCLENYLNPAALQRLIPGITIELDAYTDVKRLCSSHPQAAELGGRGVVEKHFCSQTLQELQQSFRLPDNSDEFRHMYGKIIARLQDTSPTL